MHPEMKFARGARVPLHIELHQNVTVDTFPLDYAFLS